MSPRENVKLRRRPKISEDSETTMLGCKITEAEKEKLKIASEKLGYPTVSYLVRTIINGWVTAFNRTHNV